MKHLLVVDDNDAMRDGIILSLKEMGYEATGLSSGEEAVELCRREYFDLVMMDYRLGGMTGLDATREIRKISPFSDILIITAYGSIELAVEAIKEGAIDLLQKPFTPDELRVKLEFIDRHRTSLKKVEAYEERFSDLLPTDIVTGDRHLKEILEKIDKVAPSETTIFITGESGTGKELLARQIHRKSSRSSMPLISVNCGALAEGLLESELFGHEKGAFTGAMKQKRGRLELADGGTLFLDEVGDISINLQVKLLRVLQEGEFERVGGEKTIRVDVRWICATNRDIWAMVERGEFREDLYYRLHVVPVEVPPLRMRPGDIDLLLDHFTMKYAGERRKRPLEFDSDAINALRLYSWPGNVRELENLVEMLSILHQGETITVDRLPPKIVKNHQGAAPEAQPVGDLESAIVALEIKMIRRALEACGGKKSEAADLLGIKANTLHYKMKKYGML